MKLWRLKLIALISLLYTLYLVYPLFSLQVGGKREKLIKRGKKQYIVKVELPSFRGEIYDRENRPLSLNIPGINLYQVGKAHIPLSVARKYGLRLKNHIKKGRAYLVGYGLPYDFLDIIRSYDGDRSSFIIRKNWLRDYPYGEAVSTLIGYVGREGRGLEGLEFILDKYLRGNWGYEYMFRIANGKLISLSELPRKEPARGVDTYLTIDAELSDAIYSILQNGVEEFMARGGSVVVLNPMTGEILALVNYPSVDPENLAGSKGYERRNRILTDPYEPGSTFKIVIYTLAYEEGWISPEDTVDTGEGKLVVQGKIINDVHPLGKITFRDALVFSSNVAASILSLKHDRKKLFLMARKFGFGTRTGVFLPGESPGRLDPYYEWDSIRTANIAIGQGILVNGLQMALAYAAVANGGLLLAPRLIKRIGSKKLEGKITIRKVMSLRTSQLLKEILREVVIRGTGRKARIDMVDVAGKTGTAQKVDQSTGRYGDDVIASFVGFFPVEEPQYLVYVVIDEPKAKPAYGGNVAAPIFREIALYIIRRDRLKEREKLVAR